MGREVRCACRWGERAGNVTALLESSEIVVRGDIRARAPLNVLEELRVDGDDLVFSLANDRVVLTLGAKAARSWAAKIATPPPSLAHKLGISPATRVYVSGTIDDAALAEAIAIAAESAAPPAQAALAILRTDEAASIVACVAALRSAGSRAPLWIVYRKGRAAPLGEGAVREIMRDARFMDTKVASVSAELTALRFDGRST